VGRGAIDGRPVAVSADDFTNRGGSSESYLHEKNVQAELMAAEYGLPLLRLLDGTGGGGSVAEIEKLGATYVPYVPGFDQVVANLAPCRSCRWDSGPSPASAQRGSSRATTR